MTHEDEVAANANTRRRIIETAQLNCYEARSQCLRAKSRVGDVPRNYRLVFQDAILDYYWALRPLREQGAVKDWWDGVKLSENWVRTAERESRAQAERFDSRREIRGGGEETEPIAGIDELAEITELKETVTEQRSTIRGEMESAHVRQRVLPFSVLSDFSGVLDDAAGKLGFNPQVPTPKEVDPDPI